MTFLYYDEFGVRYPNKIKALQKTKNLYFDYYDEVYDKLNWKIEPTESLDFYYKHQAQRIRDEYDYVILCYSGGYDSTNILETFYYNNIKLDKIVVTGPFSQDRLINGDENHNGEIYLNAFPYLKELGLDSITQVIDYTEHYGKIETFSAYNLGESWVEEIGSRFSPHHWFWRDLDRFVIPKQFEDKKVAIIWGTDKPNLRIKNGVKSFRFIDTAITSYGRTNQPFRSNITNINFYWDPNYPLILLKQLHVIKNLELPLTPKPVVNLIYNLKKPLIYKSGKTIGFLIAKRDMFLMNHKDTKIFDFYKQGIKKLEEYFPDSYKNLPSIDSKYYAIE